MAHYKVPGVSIAVIRDGRIAWARGYGVLQAGKPERVDTATLFSVGSLSKVATAAIALRLVDAGTLDLDRDVRSEEHTSELQSLMRISYAVFCLKKKEDTKDNKQTHIMFKTTIQHT